MFQTLVATTFYVRSQCPALHTEIDV